MHIDPDKFKTLDKIVLVLIILFIIFTMFH